MSYILWNITSWFEFHWKLLNNLHRIMWFNNSKELWHSTVSNLPYIFLHMYVIYTVNNTHTTRHAFYNLNVFFHTFLRYKAFWCLATILNRFNSSLRQLAAGLCYYFFSSWSSLFNSDCPLLPQSLSVHHTVTVALLSGF